MALFWGKVLYISPVTRSLNLWSSQLRSRAFDNQWNSLQEYLTHLVKLFLLIFKFHSLWNSVNLWFMAFQLKFHIQQHTWCWVVTSDCIWLVYIYIYICLSSHVVRHVGKICMQVLFKWLCISPETEWWQWQSLIKWSWIRLHNLLTSM